ncbi:hypothetical protein CDL15_Pgr002551 [Punica granatum]|uniref:Uncharacterized protein n=1 Tax=Punica granatum TaxID=22663 RepID=A0A218VZZ6_PUNGR|nr:hypothetical protein CDL15_Pgr002551 [Punica granatum]
MIVICWAFWAKALLVLCRGSYGLQLVMCLRSKLDDLRCMLGRRLISSLRRLLVEDAPVLLLGRLLALTEADLIIVAVSGQSAEAVAVASLGLVIGFFVWSSCSLLSLEVDLPVEAIACWGCPSVAFVAVAC